MDPNLESSQQYGSLSSVPPAQPQSTGDPSLPEPTAAALNRPSCPATQQPSNGLLSNMQIFPKILQRITDAKDLLSTPQAPHSITQDMQDNKGLDNMHMIPEIYKGIQDVKQMFHNIFKEKVEPKAVSALQSSLFDIGTYKLWARKESLDVDRETSPIADSAAFLIIDEKLIEISTKLSKLQESHETMANSQDSLPHKSKRGCVRPTEPYPEHAIILPNGKHLWYVDKEGQTVDSESIGAHIRNRVMAAVLTLFDETAPNDALCLRVRRNKKSVTFNCSGGRTFWACDSCIKAEMPCIRMDTSGYTVKPRYDMPISTWI